MEVEKKLVEMGLSLPPSPTPVANYVPAVRSGNLLFVSGHGPAFVKDGTSGDPLPFDLRALGDGKGWRQNNVPLYSGLHDCSGS